MEEIRVDTGRLRKEAAQLRSLNRQFHSQCRKMDGTWTSLDRMWDGDANNRFRTEYKAGRNEFDAFYKLIEQYASKLEEIARNYDRAEAVNVCIAGRK